MERQENLAHAASIGVLIGLLVTCACSHAMAAVATEVSVSITGETAGIDGRAWEQTYPAADTVDAVHRAVLLRFPGAMARVQHYDHRRFALISAQVLLDYKGYELAPAGYAVRNNLGQAQWKSNPPQWHIVAWPLRQSWTNSVDAGPTFNARVRGTSYWGKYGVSDADRDRYPLQLGPVELSVSAPHGRLDVMPFVSSKQLWNGIRELEENGILLRKLETYDARYRERGIAYEWAMPTGGHGLQFANPRLLLTFAERPPARKAVARRHGTPARNPHAVSGYTESKLMANADEFAELVASRELNVQALPVWRLQRLKELYEAGGDRASGFAKSIDTADYAAYVRALREILSYPPRFWQGWAIQDDLLIWHLYGSWLPPYVRDHMQAYWEAWLMPDISTSELVHPQSREAIDYWNRTHDWRGRASFFRDGYNYRTSTQNFNHTAPMGALLGGQIINSARAMADGRHGLEHFPLRLWGMLDGSSQEMLDHYYFSITLSAQKMFADFGPTAFDRLVGRVLLDRSMEMLATSYHPALRRAVNPSSRTTMPYVLLIQEGIYSVLHTLSRKGALFDPSAAFSAKADGMSVWGSELPPGRVAVQGAHTPWAPDWLSDVIDEKRFPFEETSTETTRGYFDPPLWRRMFLGRHYGLATQDIKSGTVDVLAQWNHRAGQASSHRDLGALTIRYVLNAADMVSSRAATIGNGGNTLAFQHKNRAIVCTRPRSDPGKLAALAGEEGVKTLAAVLALWSFRPHSDRELYIDGKAVKSLPARAKHGQLITLHDGVSYLAIIPLPAADLGRTDELLIDVGRATTPEVGADAPIGPALAISSFNLQAKTPVDITAERWRALLGSAYGGYILELGDESEYGSFNAFERRMRANRVTTRWDAAQRVLHVAYTSGKDIMEMGCGTTFQETEVHYPLLAGDQLKAIPYRRINGEWPYLPSGIERDTPIAQQGTTGRLEKNGAALVTEPGRKAYLQAHQESGTVVAYNPLPDLTPFRLELPGGGSILSRGKVGLMRLEVNTRTGKLVMDHALKAEQLSSEVATQLEVAGPLEMNELIVNGTTLAKPHPVSGDNGHAIYIIPLETAEPVGTLR